jgi:hypothetical protein
MVDPFHLRLIKHGTLIVAPQPIIPQGPQVAPPPVAPQRQPERTSAPQR